MPDVIGAPTGGPIPGTFKQDPGCAKPRAGEFRAGPATPRWCWRMGASDFDLVTRIFSRSGEFNKSFSLMGGGEEGSGILDAGSVMASCV